MMLINKFKLGGKFIIYSGFISLFIFMGSKLFSQSTLPRPKHIPEYYNQKIQELYDYTAKDGFKMYKRVTVAMDNKTEFPILVEFFEGKMYHFIVAADPESDKVEMKLGLESVGDFITYRFKPTKGDDYWTTFTWVCPRTGLYLYTFYQRGRKKDPMLHVGVLEHQGITKSGQWKH